MMTEPRVGWGYRTIYLNTSARQDSLSPRTERRRPFCFAERLSLRTVQPKLSLGFLYTVPKFSACAFIVFKTKH